MEHVKKVGSNILLMSFLVTIATGIGSLVSSYALQVPVIVTKLGNIETITIDTRKELKVNSAKQTTIQLSVEKINGRLNIVENSCEENEKDIEKIIRRCQ